MAENDPITIRPARAPDLAAIGDITARSWQRTFAGLLAPDFLRSLAPAAQQDRHRRLLARDGVHYHVACAGPEVVGFASWGPARDAGPGLPHELYALYLRPGFARRGIGRRLFRTVAAEAARLDPAGLYLTALAINPNRAFYARLGGTETAAPAIRLGGVSHAQVAFLWRPLPPVPPAPVIPPGGDGEV